MKGPGTAASATACPGKAARHDEPPTVPGKWCGRAADRIVVGAGTAGGGGVVRSARVPPGQGGQPGGSGHLGDAGWRRRDDERLGAAFRITASITVRIGTGLGVRVGVGVGVGVGQAACDAGAYE
ncbi:hypothetical protein GCM10010522_18480 [Kribbella solani]